MTNNPFCKWGSIEESRAFRAQFAEQAVWAFSADEVACHLAYNKWKAEDVETNIEKGRYSCS